MQTEAHTDHQSAGDASGQDINTCPNCSALMPSTMRFCRSCGTRLGEGVEEYTETVRFQSAPHTSRSGKSQTAPAAMPFTSPTGVKDWGAVARDMRGQAVKSVTTGLNQWKLGRACRRVPRWMVWVMIPFFIIALTGGFFSNSRIRVRNRASASSAASEASGSYLGSHYKTSQGGAFVEDIAPPGSAADKAGLVGGDVITLFDGKPVKSESDLNNLLSQTPVGKTVEVAYIRDGETKTAKVITISESENGRLEEAFDERPEGKGLLGVNDDFKRVQVADTNIYGVKVEVIENSPADTAGLQDGDIIIEFNGTPIRTPGELNQRIDRALPKSTVMAVVMRGSQRLEIPIKMGKE
jgi:hypothetical protein